MDADMHNQLSDYRFKLGISQPESDAIASWAACCRTGDDLAQAWFAESWCVFLGPEGREELVGLLAKGDPGPDAALTRIGRVLDTSHAWQGELIDPAMVLAKAVELRRKHTQKRWVLGLQRLCDPAEPVDAVTRGIALKGLLQTDKAENVDGILRKGPFIHEYGIRVRHMDELGLVPEVRKYLLVVCPDLAAEASQGA
jgi:hypothetical protein